MKIKVEGKKKDIMLVIGIVSFTALAMYLFWIIKLHGYSMPIQHTVSYSGEFTTTLGKVREIVIQHKKMDEPVKLDISIYDSNHRKCWEKNYNEFVITGGNQTLDSFEKASPLELEAGLYNVDIRVNGTPSNNLNCRFIEYSGSYKEIYSFLCVLLLIGEVGIIILSRRDKISLEAVYFCSVIILGLIMNFVMPPLGVPDEKTHFMEAYKLSSKMLGQEHYDDKRYLMIREEDYNTIHYLHDISSIVEWYDTFHIMGEKEKSELVSSGYKSSVTAKSFYTYLVPAVGITFARLFNFSGHMVLFMGRIFNLVFLAFLTSLAIKWIPYAKCYFLILGMLPEVIYLFTSYSYDGMNLGLCMMSMAYFLRLCKEKEQIKAKQLLSLGIMLLLMIPIKVVYIFFGVLTLLLPIKKITLSLKKIAGIAIMAVMGVSIFLVTNLSRIISVLGSRGNISTYNDPSANVTLGFVLQNRERSLLVFLNTIFANTNTYLNNALGEIVGSGRYDGLDCYVLPMWMICVIIVLMIIGLEDTKENTMIIWKRALGMAAGIAIYLAVLASMFFAFTAISAHRITGIQGRYFLPILVLMPLIVKNSLYEIRYNKRKICYLGMGFVNLLFTFLIFWHYAGDYFA